MGRSARLCLSEAQPRLCLSETQQAVFPNQKCQLEETRKTVTNSHLVTLTVTPDRIASACSTRVSESDVFEET